MGFGGGMEVAVLGAPGETKLGWEGARIVTLEKCHSYGQDARKSGDNKPDESVWKAVTLRFRRCSVSNER